MDKLERMSFDRTKKFNDMNDPGNSGWCLAGHWLVGGLYIWAQYMALSSRNIGVLAVCWALWFSHLTNYNAARKRATWMAQNLIK